MQYLAIEELTLHHTRMSGKNGVNEMNHNSWQIVEMHVAITICQ